MIKEFLRAYSPEEAVRMRLQAGEGAAFLAGGTEIHRLGSSVRCEKVVYLKDVGLDTITTGEDQVLIGSSVTLQRIIDHPHVPNYLKEAAAFCASRTRRNMATIGGNIALARDDSYLMATLIAAKARMIICDIDVQGAYTEENIPIREYHEFLEHFSNSLILSILLNKPGRFVASRRFARTAQSPAAATISFGADISSGSPHDVRICAALKGTGVIRLIELEERIAGDQHPKPEDIAIPSTSEILFVEDGTGSASYKRYIVTTAVADLYRSCLTAIEHGGFV